MTSNPEVSPFIGYVETTVDALRLIYAAQQDIIPRITRRLNDSERRSMIRSGAVFVFWVQESQIKDCLLVIVDGLLWSQSGILGNFLVYCEIDERTASRGHKKPYPHDDSPTRSLTGESSPDQASLGFGTRGGQGTFKTGGLMKKIRRYIRSGMLKRPSTRADIMNLYMPPHIFRQTTFRVPPMVEIGPDGKCRLVSEGQVLESFDCEVKLEDSGCTIPASPPWLSRDSLTSPVDNPFHGSPLYPLSLHTTSASSSVYSSRGASNERWPGPNDSMLSLIQPLRQVMSWSPPAEPVMSSGHRMSDWQDDVVQSETWPSTHSQSGLHIANVFNGLPLGPTSETVGTDWFNPLASSSLPPSSRADATGVSRTHTVLEGKISALKFIQEIFGLAPVPGLPNLVGVVLNISDVVNVSFGATQLNQALKTLQESNQQTTTARRAAPR